MTIKCPTCFTDNNDTETFCVVCGTGLKTIPSATIELPHGTVLEHKDIVTNQIYRYRIQTHIGRGGFAITYRAINEVTKEIVVIKERFPDKRGGRNKGKVNWGFGTPREEIEKAIDAAEPAHA